MEITWYGHACFRLSERGMPTIVCDPFDPEAVGLAAPRLKPDVVTISCDTPEHNHMDGLLTEPMHTLSGPGEFEIGGVFITAVQSGSARNVVFAFDYNGLSVAHLGRLNHTLSQADIEALGPVHIVLAPVGGGDALSPAKAVEVAQQLEALVIIPMQYDVPGITLPLEPLHKFVKALEAAESEPLNSFKISSPSALPEKTRLVVLNIAG